MGSLFGGYGPNLPQSQGSGSGFVWDHSGHIVTNYHVSTSFVMLPQPQSSRYASEHVCHVLRCHLQPSRLPLVTLLQ